MINDKNKDSVNNQKKCMDMNNETKISFNEWRNHITTS